VKHEWVEFDAKRALAYAVHWARPRRVGTPEHARVADEIEAALTAAGWRVRREAFHFTTAPDHVLKLLLGAALGCVLITLLWRAWWAALLLPLIALAGGPFTRRAQAAALNENSRLGRLGAAQRGQNLIAEWPDGAADDRPHLYLVAHYDSKSQRLPLAVRIACFVIAVTAGLTMWALTLLNSAPGAALLAGAIAALAIAPLLTLDVGNRSPGAIDNASGVGLVVHLAEVLAGRPVLDRLRVTILISDAEEWFVMGASAYVQAHLAELHNEAQRLHVLNFDGIGVDGALHTVGGDKTIGLLHHLEAWARDNDRPLKTFRLLGALFDHLPFAQQGFDAVSLIAVGGASRSVHTPRDDASRLDVRGFEWAGRVTLDMIDQLLNQEGA
jgi:hypothetical protein